MTDPRAAALARYQDVLAKSMSAQAWVDAHGDLIGRAMHEASQVGGPWTPCQTLYGSPECEHGSMGRHVASILVYAPAGDDRASAFPVHPSEPNYVPGDNK